MPPFPLFAYLFGAILTDGMSIGTPNRIPSLDGVRALSILFVVGGHLWTRVYSGSAATLFATLGVHIFFVLSGYLITTLLQQERERNGHISLIAFYRRRCFRIFPAAFTYIAVVTILSPISRPGLLYALTYTVSYHAGNMPLLFGHLWSLSVEEQFYLLWPLALVLGFRYRARIAWTAIASAAAFRLALALSTNYRSLTLMHYSFFGTMDSVGAGCLLAIYYPSIREKCAWMTTSWTIPLATGATIWIVSIALWGGPESLGRRLVSISWGFVPLAIALELFLLIERRDWIFNNPVASWLGALSYSLYLWQEGFTLCDWPPVLGLALLTVCAFSSYVLIEKPMLRLGSRTRPQSPELRSVSVLTT
jgi:peptidoglycan/LPS O-acetylase OafA/YrhL